MASAAQLYSPAVLALATSLARYPFAETMTLQGQARSVACGSSLAIGLELDEAGRIAQIGLKTHACAIGQAAAAIFAAAAIGAERPHIAASAAEIANWLNTGGPAPNWPGVAALDAAREYPGRHGAILLAWKATLAALPTG